MGIADQVKGFVAPHTSQFIFAKHHSVPLLQVKVEARKIACWANHVVDTNVSLHQWQKRTRTSASRPCIMNTRSWWAMTGPVHLVHPRLLLIESMGDNSQQRQINVSERLSKIPITHSSCALISMCFKLFVSHVFLTGVKAQCLMTCHQAW